MAKYVRLPQLRRQHGKTVRGFNDRWDFPQCFGAINGTHIPIHMSITSNFQVEGMTFHCNASSCGSCMNTDLQM